MGFDIRSLFSRALGGRHESTGRGEGTAPEEFTDEEAPGSPIQAASAIAASPDLDDLSTEGATASTALLPEGLEAMPSAAVDGTSASAEDDEVDEEQAVLIAEVAVAAALVERQPDDEELSDLLETLREVPGLDGFSDEHFDRLLDELGREDVTSSGEFVAQMEDRLEDLALTLTDPALRRATYELAVYFCAWDDEVTDSEEDYLGAVAEAFEIGAREAERLLSTTINEAHP